MESSAEVTINITDAPELEYGLAAYYPFNGNANDESGNSLNGIALGATLADDRFGNTNSAYSFDGSPSYISLPNVFNLLPRTLSLWFNATETNYGSAYGAIFQSDNPALEYGATGIAVRDTDFSNSKELILVISGGVYLTGINTNTWHNITMVADATKETRFYIDGVLVSDQVFDDFLKSVDGLELTIFGAGRHADNSYFNGAIDDIRNYDRVLSEEEISLIFSSSR